MNKIFTAIVALGIVLAPVPFSGCKSDTPATTPVYSTPPVFTTSLPGAPTSSNPVTTTNSLTTAGPTTQIPYTPKPTTTTTTAPTATPTSTTTLPPTSTTTPPPPTTSIDPYMQSYHGYLLEGYPEDIWPVYGSLAIDLCSLDIQFPAYNNGRDGYYNNFSVIYVTDKTREEIQVYYRDLLQTAEESNFYDALGTIDGYEVSARWDDWSSDTIVYLSVLLPNNLGITENYLQTDFPEWLGDLYKPDETWQEHYACNSNPPNGSILSSKMFSYKGTSLEAIEHYRAMLKDAEDYTETVKAETQGDSTTLSCTVDGLRVKVTIGVWGKQEIIQVAYFKYS
ncbi:MAG: hypothetical protein PHX29_04080 [Dehalococcoidales bacterium]|jgi:hypothetical protein|nr:hypothetical protein [Dehalococcoidales bacterium]